MGKKKTRAKGNPRPSSSRHSAELLNSASGAASPALIGFQNYPLEATGLTTPAGNPEEEGTGNVRVVMKMMLKKDVVTKLKGIQEFTTLCLDDNENAMKFLPYFPRIYNKLALETNVRVREAIQRALEMFIPMLKKDIVPYLRSFMATWLITQCDPYSTAACGAQSAFFKSFPEHKQSYAMMYCQSEILKAIKDNLCEVTEDSLSESGGLTEDTCREKYELILICSVRGLKLFISLLSEEDKVKIIQPVNDIVSDKHFWRHSQSIVSKVRAAWYELLHMLTSEIPEVFQGTKSDLISVVLNSLWKNDPQAIRSIWDCAIEVFSTFEDWWHQVNVPKMVFSPLLEFLNCGGYGNATLVYPVLQEFLRQLMAVDVIGWSFYMEFFSSIRKSFSRCKLKSSPKECDAVMKGFMDCLEYITKVFVKDTGGLIHVTELVAKQLMPLIQSSLKPDGCNIASSSFYALLGLYLQNLEKANMEDNQKLGNDSPYYNILTFLWESISQEITGHLDTSLKEGENDLSVLVLFFHCLHRPLIYLSASERKMYFCGESSTISIDTSYFVIGNSPNIIARIKASDSCRPSFLFKYTVGFCGYLCLKLQRSLKPCCIELCAEIISDTSCHQLFFELLETLQVPVPCVAVAPAVFFKVVIEKWIKCACKCFDESSLNRIADIIICICFSVEKNCAVLILELCSVMEHQKVFLRLVMKTVAYKDGRELFQLWFRSPVFLRVFEVLTVSLATTLVYDKLNLDSPETALCSRSLMLCFTKAGSEKPEIPWKSIQKILNYFTSVMSNRQYMNCENQGDYNVIDFISDAADKLFFQDPWSYLNRREVTLFLFKVFTLSVDWAEFNITECHKEQRQLDYLWKTSVAYVVQDERDLNENNFLLMAAGHLHDLLLTVMSKKRQNRVMQVTCLFLEKVEEAYCDMSINNCESLLIFLIKKILPSFQEFEKARNELHMGTVVPILNGGWFYPFVPDECLPISNVIVPPLLFIADAVAELLQKVWAVVADKCKRQIQAVYHKILCSQYLPHVLWSVCYADSLNFFKAQDAAEPTVILSLRESFSYLMEKCNICQLVTVISGLVLHNDMTWGIPFEKVMQAALLETSTPLDYFNTFSFAFNQCRSNYLTLTQICLKYTSKEFAVQFLNRMYEAVVGPNGDCPVSEKDFHGMLSQLAQCIQQHGLRFAPRVRKKVVLILEKVAKSERFCSLHRRNDVLVVVGFTAVAVVVINNAQNEISGDLWTSLTEIAIDWFKRCVEIEGLALRDSSSLIFVQQTCKLIAALSQVVQEGLEDKEADTVFKELANDHWKTLFEANISKQLVKLFLQFSDYVSILHQTSNAVDSLLFALVQALEFLSTEQIFEAVLSIHSSPSSTLDLCERIDSAYKVLHGLTQYLKSKSICVQFGIHFLLKKVLVHLPKIDQRQRSFDDAENEDTFRSSPLVEVLAQTNEAIQQLLGDVKPTECCILQPFTDCFTFGMANLLAWHIFLEYFSASVTEERSVYVGCLADSEMLSCMLMNVIRLRPENPSACSGHIPRKLSEEDDELKVDLHEVPPMYSLGTPSSKHLQHVACSVYVAALKKIPALVRTWWSNLDKKTAYIVEKFTAENISKILLLNEMNSIHAYKDQFSNMTVDAYASSRQVVATYTLDDATIELSIKIPQNFPLGPVVASSIKKTIVEPNQWRSWMFQLTTFLNFHNGSIKDALLLWKKNLNKRFEGVEECMICCFILHSSSGTLPNKTCRTCKKKFHGSCLFKWFKTSNSCSCPGCRNDF